MLIAIEKNNVEMREIFNQQIHENKRADQEIKTEGINSLVQVNASYQKSIKSNLAIMAMDLKASEAGLEKDEPETRIKKTLHRTLTSKFRDVLRASQAVQTEFKNAVNARLKKQIRLTKKDATEEEIEALARDPEAVQKLMQ